MTRGYFAAKFFPAENPEWAEVDLDKREAGTTMEVSPPILVRIEWADSQGRVTASWLAAHFKFSGWSGTQLPLQRIDENVVGL